MTIEKVDTGVLGSVPLFSKLSEQHLARLAEAASLAWPRRAPFCSARAIA